MKKDLIHCIAHCDDCPWMEEDFLIAKNAGIRHRKKTGHTVNIQEGLSVDYKNGKRV